MKRNKVRRNKIGWKENSEKTSGFHGLFRRVENGEKMKRKSPFGCGLIGA